MMGLASFFFQIAGVIWYILLALVKLATEGDILNSAAKTLDGIFHDVAKPIVQSPYLLGALVVFVGIWTIWRVLKHGYGHAIRKLFQALVPLALVGIIFNAAASDNGTGRVPFSPAWIVKGVDSLSNQLGKITFVALTPPQQANAPSCEQYEAGLQAEFASNASSTTNTAVPEAMNDLWEQSYLYAWGAAQFYDANTGKRVDCRVLESANNVDPSTQSIVQQLGSTQASMPANPPGWNKTIFNDTGMSDALTATATAFAACQYVDGQWQVTKAGLLNTSAGDGPTANDCSVWWHGKVAASGSFPDNGAAFCSACNGQTLGQINGEQAPGDPLGTEFLNAYNGNNSGSAVVYGFFALISALFYAFALGALTLGTFLAQFILIAVLCALPLLLIAMAVSDRAEEMAHRIVLIGARTMVAKTVFLIVIGLLTTLVEVANSLVGGAGNGLGVVFAAAIAPLLAFAGLHMLMKQFNMHGMLSLKGAVLTTAGFAMYKHYREDQSPRPGAESALASARNRIRHPLRSGTLGRRRTDASRPGGARPPEAGTHHRSRLYKNRSGENGESQAGARSGNGSGDGAGESGTEELANSRTGRPNNPFAATEESGKHVRTATASARRRFASFRAPAAVASRKAARKKHFHTALGITSMIPGGVGVAAGIAGTVATGARARSWAGAQAARINAVKQRRTSNREARSTVRSVLDHHNGRAHQQRIAERRESRAARVEARSERWRTFHDDATARGRFHTDLASKRWEVGRQSVDRAKSNKERWADVNSRFANAPRGKPGTFGTTAGTTGKSAAGKPNGQPTTKKTNRGKGGAAAAKEQPKTTGGAWAAAKGASQPSGPPPAKTGQGRPGAPRRPAAPNTPRRPAQTPFRQPTGKGARPDQRRRRGEPPQNSRKGR